MNFTKLLVLIATTLHIICCTVLVGQFFPPLTKALDMTFEYVFYHAGVPQNTLTILIFSLLTSVTVGLGIALGSELWFMIRTMRRMKHTRLVR